jgi:glucose-1-phosphate thymidylyltransferase
MRGDRVEKIIEKPTPEQRTTNLSSLPLYVLSKNIFAELSELKPSTRGEYELPEAFQNVIAKGGVINGVTIPSRMDLTDQTDLLALNEYFLKRQSPAVLVSDSFVPSSAVLEGPVLVESEVSLGQGVHLGPCVYIEKGASVSDGVRLERVVVLRGAKVASSASGRVIVT